MPTDDLDDVVNLLKDAPQEPAKICPYRLAKLSAEEQERAKKRPYVYRVACSCGQGSTC